MTASNEAWSGARLAERHPGGAVLGVAERGVAVAEGAAHGVLAAEAHREALEQQGAVGERLGAAPVDALAALHHLVALVEQPLGSRAAA